MRSIIKTSLQFRFLVVTLAAVLMFVGIARIGTMPVDALPEFAPPYVEVQTEALGLSANEVETLITLNLEELLNGVPGRQSIRSTSVPGMSSIRLTFAPGTDVMRARQLVQERLVLAHMLPNVSRPPVLLQPLSATSRVMTVGLSSKNLSLIEMSVLARWKIRPALMSVPGVANVAIWGQRDRQLQVLVDPEQLRAQGVTLDQIIETTGNALWVSPLTFLNASTPGTGGWIDTPQQRLEVRHVLPISGPADLAQVTVHDAAALRLGDVAQVVENHQLLIGDAVVTDGPGLLLVVEKFPGTNTLAVTRGVEKAIDVMRPGLTGIEFDTDIFRQATFGELALANLGKTMLIGAALLVLVLLAFFFQWRSVLISALIVPLSTVTSLVVLDLRGATLNVMVLAGLTIAIGVVVNNAIADVDNVVRRLRQPRREGDDRSIATVVLDASFEMRGALLFATLITVIAVVPVFFLTGVSGEFYRPLALSYVLAVLASMAVALTVTPALCLILLGNTPRERRESPLIRWLQHRYDGVLARTVRRPRLAYTIIAVFLLAGIGVLPFLRQGSLLPSFKEPNLMVQWEERPGTSQPEMTRITTEASRELRAIPGVSDVGVHIGRAVLGDQIVGINSARLWISLDPQANYEATVAAIQATVDRYPGVVRGVQTYLQDTLSQLLTGSSDDMVVRISGPEFGVLRSKAQEVQQALSKIDGVANLNVERQVEEPYVEIEVDLAKAQVYGIKPGDVRRAAATLVNGLEAGSLFEDQKVFEVVVWSTPETRHSLTSLRELLIDTPGGAHVRLEDVADVRVRSTQNTIHREAVTRRIDVGLNVNGRDLGAVAGDVERALRNVDFPLEYHAELLGEHAERQAALQRMLVAIAIAVAGIFLLLQASFQSWRLAALAFLTSPWALAGGLLAAVMFSGGALSLGALVGLLTVFGLAVRNGVMLIKHYQYLEAHEGETFGSELVRRGSRERMVPIVMTALTTGLLFVPFVFFGSIPGLEIQQPMAVVILGGLVTSTLLSLFVVPVLYLRFGESRYEPLPIRVPAAVGPFGDAAHPADFWPQERGDDQRSPRPYGDSEAH